MRPRPHSAAVPCRRVSGATVGFRIAARRPERITAIISQNGSACEEGLSDAWDSVWAYWKEPSEANREEIRMLVEPQTSVWQHAHGVLDKAQVSPDGYGLGSYYLTRRGPADFRFDRFFDDTSNVAQYRCLRSTFTPAGHCRPRRGTATNRSSCQPERRPSIATSPALTLATGRPATSPWRRTSRRSRPAIGEFLARQLPHERSDWE